MVSTRASASLIDNGTRTLTVDIVDVLVVVVSLSVLSDLFTQTFNFQTQKKTHTGRVGVSSVVEFFRSVCGSPSERILIGWCPGVAG